MASFSVNITTNTTPAVVNTLSGTTTYAQFKASLGTFVYYISKIYIYSPTLQQIQGNFRYIKYDANGSTNTETVISTIDPNQSFNSLFIETTDKSLVLDGRDFVKFTLLPNTSLSIKIYCTQLEVGNANTLLGLPNAKGGNTLKDNFKALEFAQGIANYFEQYKEFL